MVIGDADNGSYFCLAACHQLKAGFDPLPPVPEELGPLTHSFHICLQTIVRHSVTKISKGKVQVQNSLSYLLWTAVHF